MRTSSAIAALGLTLTLGGCMTTAERQAQQAAWEAKFEAEADEKCRSYGAKPGTDAYVACRTNITTTAMNAIARRNDPKPDTDVTVIVPPQPRIGR